MATRPTVRIAKSPLTSFINPPWNVSPTNVVHATSRTRETSPGEVRSLLAIDHDRFYRSISWSILRWIRGLSDGCNGRRWLSVQSAEEERHVLHIDSQSYGRTFRAGALVG